MLRRCTCLCIFIILATLASVQVNSLHVKVDENKVIHFDQNDKAAATPNITKVHVVYMNHLDVGYSAMLESGFINNVLNLYFVEYFRRAAKLGEELRSVGFSNYFKYTTHPWLVSLFIDCPQNFVLSGIKLKCPSKEDLDLFYKAIANGDITWHAGPMNMQLENSDQTMLNFGLSLSDDLDRHFNITRKNKVLSQRDVPGMTHAVIPSLLKKGIIGVSVGVNPMTAPPAVPSVFRWRYGNDEIIATWHPGGYPDNPGPGPKHPGGLSRKDCHLVDGHPEALCFAFRNDNSGPPRSVLQILDNYYVLQSQFPGAVIRASSLSEYFEGLLPIRSKLPVVAKELGDTWIQGISSAPGKMAAYRAVERVFAECVEKGSCDYKDRRFYMASRYILKMGEHTYGLNELKDNVNWANAMFAKAKHYPTYLRHISGWIEHRNFTDLTLKSLADHEVVGKVEEELAKIKVTGTQPDLTDFKIVSWSNNPFQCAGGVEIGFSQLGGMNFLKYNGTQWADADHVLGQFIYISYNETDFDSFGKQYNYNGHSAGYVKKHLTHFANPASLSWNATLHKMYQNTKNPCDFYLHSETHPFSVTNYGAPKAIWSRFTVRTTGDIGVDVDIRLYNKTPTRLPEALMVTYAPEVKDNFMWMMDKVGHTVDPLNVILNGSQHQHAIDKGVYYVDRDSLTGIQIHALDTPIVCVATADVKPTVFPAPLRPVNPPITSMSFNVYNNIWDTNYIYWYPFLPEDANLRARFSIDFLLKGNKPHRALKNMIKCMK